MLNSLAASFCFTKKKQCNHGIIFGILKCFYTTTIDLRNSFYTLSTESFKIPAIFYSFMVLCFGFCDICQCNNSSKDMSNKLAYVKITIINKSNAFNMLSLILSCLKVFFLVYQFGCLDFDVFQCNDSSSKMSNLHSFNLTVGITTYDVKNGFHIFSKDLLGFKMIFQVW